MAAMMEGEDGPPADVVDGVQSTMNSIVDKAGVTVAAAAAAVGEVLKSSLGGVLNTTPKPKAAAKKKAKKMAKKRTASKAAKKKRKRAAKAVKAAPVTPPKAPAREEPAAEDAPPAPESGENAPPAVADATAAVPAFAVGARVEAKWAEEWFCAVVEEAHADGSYEVEWVDDPNVFNAVAAADVRAAATEDDARAAAAAAAKAVPEAAPESEEEEEEAAPPAPPAADDGEEAMAGDVLGLLDNAAPRVVVDMLFANESFAIAFNQTNPKRPDSASFVCYEAYKAATCVAAVLASGGSKSDVLYDYKKGFLRVTRCPAMIAHDLDRDDVASERADPEGTTPAGRPARRSPKRKLFVAESATVHNKKAEGGAE